MMDALAGIFFSFQFTGKNHVIVFG